MIEPVSKDSLGDVIPLILAYQDFYKVADISDDRNLEFFAQFGTPSSAGCQFVYRIAGEAVGFATVYFSYTTSITSRVAILNDLYTLPASRGMGVGRQLIEHCRSDAAKHGAARLQWVTAPDNVQAQRLYESLDAAKSRGTFIPTTLNKRLKFVPLHSTGRQQSWLRLAGR